METVCSEPPPSWPWPLWAWRPGVSREDGTFTSQPLGAGRWIPLSPCRPINHLASQAVSVASRTPQAAGGWPMGASVGPSPHPPSEQTSVLLISSPSTLQGSPSRKRGHCLGLGKGSPGPRGRQWLRAYVGCPDYGALEQGALHGLGVGRGLAPVGMNSCLSRIASSVSTPHIPI